MYHRKDHFYRKAKKEGRASRAAYKLLEINEKFSLWRKGSSILDLGCAPGGWLEILAKEVGPRGYLLGIDRFPLKIGLPSHADFLQKEIGEKDISRAIKNSLKNSKGFDLILSDLSPDLSGITFKDSYHSYELALKVWNLAGEFLKKGGHLVIKIFPGEETASFKSELKKSFKYLETVIPEATRRTSSEIYLVAYGYKGSVDIDF